MCDLFHSSEPSPNESLNIGCAYPPPIEPALSSRQSKCDVSKPHTTNPRKEAGPIRTGGHLYPRRAIIRRRISGSSGHWFSLLAASAVVSS